MTKNYKQNQVQHKQNQAHMKQSSTTLNNQAFASIATPSDAAAGRAALTASVKNLPTINVMEASINSQVDNGSMVKALAGTAESNQL